MNSEQVTDWITNILSFLESTNIDEANVDLTGSDGIVGKSTAQTMTGLKTFESTSDTAGIVEVAQFGRDPSTATQVANDGGRLVFYTDDGGGTESDIAYVDWVLTTATAGSEVGRLDFYVAATGAPASQVQIRDGSITPTTTDDISLGTTALNFSDLFLDSGAVINFDSGDVVITHSANALAISGGTSYTVDALFSPATNDAAALGTTSLGFSDLHLATGGVLNWANGEVTITETDGNTLTIAGVATRVDLAAGILELNNAIELDTGVAVVATEYSVSRDADATNQLHFNVPTGALFEWSINDVAVMKIASTGYLRVGDGTAASFPLHVVKSVDGAEVVSLENSHATAPYLMRLYTSGATIDNNTVYFLNCTDATATRLYIYSDGDVQNHDNSYGAISDERLKQDIVDAGSQWDDVKALRVRKYRFKTDAALDPACPLHLGFIAQEVLEISPGLVTYNEIDDQYSMQYSIAQMKLFRAFQEAQMRIEALEAAA